MSGTSNFSYALRTLRKSPGFSIAVIVSLALGIGANAAIFSVVNGLLFHPAGISHPEELMAPRVSYKKLNLDRIGMSATDFADVRESRQIFSKAAMLDVGAFNYTGGDSPQRLGAAFVTSQWFDVFGAKTSLGRGFHAEDDVPGANKVAVLSFGTWHRLFGADRAILGRTIELNNTPYRVVGIMPADFRWPSEADIWVPIGLPPKDYGPGNRFNENYFAVARLASGISPARAAGFMQTLSKRVLDQVSYARSSQWSMVIEPLTEYAAGDLKRPTFILLGSVGLVLLIACSNIAGLMLVRGTSRARELAIRTALGANRADLIKQALVETSLLSICGTVLGLGAAFGILRVLLSLARAQLSSDILIHIDGYVLVFAVLAGVVSALLFGLAPAWHISRLGEHYDQLKEGGRSESEGHHRQALRSTLVAAQIALALVLLIGAGLLLKTLANLRNVNAGFNPKNVMTASVALPAARYKDERKQISFLYAVQQQLTQSPGVLSAAAASIVPFAGGDPIASWGDPTASFEIEGRIVPPGDPGFHGSIRAVSPDYFKTLRIPLLQGRFFTDGERKDAQAVAIIDDNMARRYWPNESPIGKRLKHNSDDPWATIVGIVGHVKQSSLAADSGRGVYYFSMYQQPMTTFLLAARGNLAPAQLAEAIRNAVRAVDPGRPSLT